MTTEQAFVLFLSDELHKGIWVPNMQQNEAALRARAAHELRRLHAQTQAFIVENETLRAGYDAARLEIDGLQKAATARHALQATGAPPAPCARYCEAVAFNIERRNLHAEIEALRTCNKDAQREIAALRAAAPAQADEYPPLVCDYCGALTPDPWHSSGMLHGKMSKHIHSCDACAARGQATCLGSHRSG